MCSHFIGINGYLIHIDKIKRDKLVSLCFEEFALEFNPVKSECMQEAFHQVHAHEYPKSDHSKNEKPEHNSNNAATLKAVCECLLKEDFRELRMCQRKSP